MSLKVSVYPSFRSYLESVAKLRLKKDVKGGAGDDLQTLLAKTTTPKKKARSRAPRPK